jgi:nucleotide-binding universal stress UspA family protein
MALQAPTRLALKNILFATDFSRQSEAALPCAVALARQFESRIRAVHVFPMSQIQPMFDAGPTVIESALLRAEDEMGKLLSCDAWEGVAHDGMVRSGIEVWSEIEAVIAAEKIDLVVLGTHGHEGLKQVVLGSIAETIFRSAPCPVLVVGPKVANKATLPVFRDLLFATDLGPASLRALPFVQTFAEENRADVVAVHVSQEKARDRKDQALAAESLGRWMRELIPPALGMEHEVRFGSPAESILQVADERRSDLILLGAHHASNFATHVPGAVAHRIVAEARCPVMTVHGQESAPVAY